MRTTFAIPLALALAAAAAPLRPLDAAARTVTVTISDYAFSPDKVVVHRGDTVKWVNEDTMPHTATALDGHSFDSAALDPGANWSFVFAKAGDYAYRCAIHPGMRGSVVVQ